MACADLKGEDFCLYLLRPKQLDCDLLKPEELIYCHKSCKVCTEAPTPATLAPSWAVQPTVLRPTLYPTNPTPAANGNSDLSIPLWAVILIVIGLIVLFLLATCAIVKIKRRCRKWKMKKNHKLLRNAPPASSTMPMSNQQGNIWQLENSGRLNHSYNDFNEKNLYLPEKSYHDPPNMVNNLGSKEKNTNALQGTISKRHAPGPPPDEVKQNNRTNTLRSQKSRAPDPPVKKEHEVVEIPVEYSESIMSAPVDDDRESLSDKNENPPVPPRMPLIMKQSMNSDATYATVYDDKKKSDPKKKKKSTKKQTVEEPMDDKSDDSLSSSDSESTVTDGTVSTKKNEFASDALIGVMEKWKDHLQDQKRELEEYYSRLATYVGDLALQQAQAPPHDDESVISESTTVTWNPINHRSTSVPIQPRRDSDMTFDFSMKSRALSQRFTFPEPPESIRGDFDIEPYNLESQQQVIQGLKGKLSELHAVLESTDEIVSEADSMATWKPRDEFEVRQLLPAKPDINRDVLMAASDTHYTVKFLLDQFDRKRRIEVQLKIAEAFDTVRSRGGMKIAPNDGPVMRLSKQVHHVMTDLLDPRTNTKLLLGAQASLNLAMKLRRKFLKTLYPVISNIEVRESMKANIEHTIVVCKQLVDMTNQLIAHEAAFREKDYWVFANAFVETAVKVMAETYTNKVDIEKLQQERDEEMIKMNSPTSPSRSKSPKSPNLTKDDVRQLNEGLARLEAVLNGHLPAAARESQRSYNDPLSRTITDNDMDTLSEYSCSTCAPLDTEYDRKYPSHMTASTFGHPPNKLPGGVQYTKVYPYKAKRDTKMPKNEVLLSKDAVNPKARLSDYYDTDQRTNTIGASSFSFDSSRNQSKADVPKQPRHEAMMARYFGGVEQPPNSESKKKLDELPRATNPIDQIDMPALQFLPCGIVASDTPPMTDKPKEKKIRGRLGKIPEITVVRNGTEVDKSSNKPNKSTKETPKATQQNIEPPVPVPPPPPAPAPPAVQPPEVAPRSPVSAPADEPTPEPMHSSNPPERTPSITEALRSALKERFPNKNAEDAESSDDDKEKDSDNEEEAKSEKNGEQESNKDSSESSDSSDDENEALFNYPSESEAATERDQSVGKKDNDNKSEEK